MIGRLIGIGRNEVVELQEIAAHFGSKEHHRTEHQQEHRYAKNVVYGVERVERNAISRLSIGVFGSVGAFDFDAIGVVRTDIVQSKNVCCYQTNQDQRHSNDVEAEEAVESGIAHHKVSANEQGQIRAHKGNGREQVHDHLGTPVGHLSPRQQVAHESLSHEGQENQRTENPDQFARFAVAAIKQAAEHVQINDHKKCRCPSRVHISNEPTVGHFAHDVLNRTESQSGVWFVVHHQENTRHDLNGQHHNRQHTKDVPKIEVFGRVILGHVRTERIKCRWEPVFKPVGHLGGRGGIG